MTIKRTIIIVYTIIIITIHYVNKVWKNKPAESFLINKKFSFEVFVCTIFPPESKKIFSMTLTAN